MKGAIDKFLRELPAWPWLQPQTQDIELLTELAKTVVAVANHYYPVPCRGVRFVTLEGARGASIDAAHACADNHPGPSIGAALCALWKLGCWPVGVCGEWFVLWAGEGLAGQEVLFTKEVTV